MGWHRSRTNREDTSIQRDWFAQHSKTIHTHHTHTHTFSAKTRIVIAYEGKAVVRIAMHNAQGMAMEDILHTQTRHTQHAGYKYALH